MVKTGNRTDVKMSTHGKKLWNHQQKMVDETIEKIRTDGKNCVGMSCGGGKTFTGYAIIDRYLKEYPGSKILIIAHAQTVLKGQFYKEGLKYKETFKSNMTIGVVTAGRNGIKTQESFDEAYSNDVTVSIPQTINSLKNLPHFDLLVFDEAHQHLLKDTVKNIVKKCGIKHMVALTGTPYPFVREKWPISIIAMNELIPHPVANFIVELASSTYKAEFSDYDKEGGRLKEKSVRRVLKVKATKDTLDKLLTFILKRIKSVWKHPAVANAMMPVSWLNVFQKLEKTMIACYDQVQAKDVAEYFSEKKIPYKLCISDEVSSAEAYEEFEKFKTDSSILVMIVVEMGILGFNHPELCNVIDISGSTFIPKIFQLMSRVARSYENKTKLFLKVAMDIEGMKGMDYFHHIMTATMCLTDERYMRLFDGENMCNLKIPAIKAVSGKRYTSAHKPKRVAKELDTWLGTPAVGLFKGFLRKYGDTSSYAYTTLGLVKKRLFLYDVEQESNKKVHELCRWIIDNGRFPNKSKYGSKTEEAIHGAFLCSKRAAAINRGDGKLFPSDIDIAKSYGFPFLFDRNDPIMASAEKMNEICDYYEEHSHWPRQKGPHRKRAIYRSGKKNAKNGNQTTIVLYPNDEAILRGRGLYEKFFQNDIDAIKNNSMLLFCKLMDSARGKL